MKKFILLSALSILSLSACAENSNEINTVTSSNTIKASHKYSDAEMSDRLKSTLDKMRKAKFNIMDQDKDGMLTQDELNSIDSSLYAVDDENKDGLISFSEFETAKLVITPL